MLLKDLNLEDPKL